MSTSSTRRKRAKTLRAKLAKADGDIAALTEAEVQWLKKYDEEVLPRGGNPRAYDLSSKPLGDMGTTEVNGGPASAQPLPEGMASDSGRVDVAGSVDGATEPPDAPVPPPLTVPPKKTEEPPRKEATKRDNTARRELVRMTAATYVSILVGLRVQIKARGEVPMFDIGFVPDGKGGMVLFDPLHAMVQPACERLLDFALPDMPQVIQDAGTVVVCTGTLGIQYAMSRKKPGGVPAPLPGAKEPEPERPREAPVPPSREPEPPIEGGRYAVDKEAFDPPPGDDDPSIELSSTPADA